MHTLRARNVVGPLVVALLSTAVGAQAARRIEMRTTRLSDAIAVLTGAGANVGVSAGKDGVLLIDDGMAPAVEEVKAAVAAIDPRAVRIVLNTNWHFDHADGNEAFAATGATILAHERSRAHMLAEQRITELDPPIVVAPYPPRALPVISIDESSVVHFNGDEIAVLHVPTAHSDGDLAFHFRRANVLFCGDLFFPDGIPFIQFSGGGTVAGMIRAADAILAATNARTRIVPGHGPVCGQAEVRTARALLVTIRDRIQALIDQGCSVDEVVATNPLADLYKAPESVPPERFARQVFDDLAATPAGATAGITPTSTK